MSPALAVLESALRARQLDRTLTTALPPVEAGDEQAVAATGIAALDVRLGGGVPRGQLSEIVGARSSGRTMLLHAMLAAATARGELVALVDTLDRLDVASAEAAGIDASRLLWVRGQAISRTEVGLSRDWHPLEARRAPERTLAPAALLESPRRGREAGSLLERTIDRALKAWTQVLQAGGFGLVVLDLADVPVEAIRRLPFTTWLRIQRLVEGRETAALLVAPAPVGRSAGGLSLQLGERDIGRSVDGAIGRLAGCAGFSAGGRTGPAQPAQSTRRSIDRSTDWLQPLPGRWTGGAPEAARFDGLDVDVRIVSPRRRADGEVTLHAIA